LSASAHAGLIGGRSGSGCEIERLEAQNIAPSPNFSPRLPAAPQPRLRCDGRRRSGTRRWEDASEAGRDAQDMQAAAPLLGHGCHATGRRACMHGARCLFPARRTGRSQSRPGRSRRRKPTGIARSALVRCLWIAFIFGSLASTRLAPRLSDAALLMLTANCA
jgi:hypothetical protein